MVTEGKLTLTVNQKAHVLHASDSISFDASFEHIYTNSSEGMLKAVVMNFYPA